MALIDILKESPTSRKRASLYNKSGMKSQVLDKYRDAYRWMQTQLGASHNAEFKPFNIEVAGVMNPITDPSVDNFENFSITLQRFFRKYFVPERLNLFRPSNLSSYLYAVVFKSVIENPQDWLTLDKEGTPRVGRPPMTFHIKKGISGTMIRKYIDDMVKDDTAYLTDEDKEEFFTARESSSY